MGKEKSSLTYLLGKLLFVTTAVVLTCLTIGWGLFSGVQVQTEYAAAEDATRDIGILSQSISGFVQKLPERPRRKTEAKFNALMSKIEILETRLSVKHASLFRGNPEQSIDAPFALEIKSIYYVQPTNTVNLVRTFLESIKMLREIPPREYSAENTHTAYISQLGKGVLIDAISQTIRQYQVESDQKLSQIALILAGSLVMLIISFLLAYIFFFLGTKISITENEQHEISASISNILKDISVLPEPKPRRISILTKKNLAPRI